MQLFISVLQLGKVRCRGCVVLTATEHNCQIEELNLLAKLWPSAHAGADASSQNDLHVFHGMPYLWKNFCGVLHQRSFTLKTVVVSAIAGGKVAMGLGGCIRTKQFTRR